MEDTTKTADDMYKMSLTKAQMVGKGKRLIFLECGSGYGSGSSIFFSFAKGKYEKHIVKKNLHF